MTSPRIERRLAAILAADVAGYSRLMGADEVGTLTHAEGASRERIDPTIASHHGRIVKTTGDGMLVEFASAVDAVRCAVDVQRGMAERNADVPPERRIEFRIGINVGDIIIDGDDIYGDGVNIAARLEAMAEPGGICVSLAVRDLVRDKLAFGFEDFGEVAAKNIARPIHVFRVHDDTGSATPRSETLSIAAPPRLSIVVLPFQNLGGDPADVYLADGITEDLTSDLSRLPGAFVIARGSAYAYQGKAIDMRRIGTELGVRYAVEGSVRRIGPMLRVNAQLISTETGAHLWSDRFDQAISDLAAGQEQIVIRMRVALAIGLTDIEAMRSARERPTSPDAFDLILQARAERNRPETPETLADTYGYMNSPCNATRTPCWP